MVTYASSLNSSVDQSYLLKILEASRLRSTQHQAKVAEIDHIDIVINQKVTAILKEPIKQPPASSLKVEAKPMLIPSSLLLTQVDLNQKIPNTSPVIQEIQEKHIQNEVNCAKTIQTLDQALDKAKEELQIQEQIKKEQKEIQQEIKTIDKDLKVDQDKVTVLTQMQESISQQADDIGKNLQNIANFTELAQQSTSICEKFMQSIDKKEEIQQNFNTITALAAKDVFNESSSSNQVLATQQPIHHSPKLKTKVLTDRNPIHTKTIPITKKSGFPFSFFNVFKRGWTYGRKKAESITRTALNILHSPFSFIYEKILKNPLSWVWVHIKKTSLMTKIGLGILTIYVIKTIL